MNSKGIGQFIQSKWQAFRAWQENPIRYRMDLTEHVCNCCGHRFIGNYCPVCSQPTGQGRITWSSIWQGIGQLWGVESKSAIYTLWQLLWRPGYPNHTIPAGFFLQVYIAILAYITQAPFAVSHPLPILLSTAYSYATYKQLFGYGYWQTLWRWTVCTGLSLVALLTVVLVAVLIGMLYQ